MARSFPGGAATDRLTITRYAEVDNLSTLSLGAWVYRSGAGGSSNGVVVTKALGCQIYEGTGNWYYFSAARWTTTTGVWRTPTGADSTWHSLVWTYSHASTSTAPLAYLDGVPATVTLQAAPAGTATNNDSANNVVIGNSPSSGFCWFGRLAEVAIWNRILTADEARYLHAVAPNAAQSGGTLASGLVGYLPITGTTSPEPNPAKPANTGAVTGTTNVASPPLFVPSGGSGSGTKLYLGSTAVYPA